MPKKAPPGSRRRYAVALRYDPSMPAPQVIGSARGEAAERAVGRARELGIPVREDAALAAALLPLDVGALVPPEYWLIVANILVAIRNVRQ